LEDFVRNRLSALRSQVLVLLVLCSVAAPAAASSNAYDKFRNENYSNKGLMSEQDELRLGAQIHQQVLQKYRLVNDPAINEYVQNLGERLARSSRRPNIPYRFYVIDDPAVNAFSIPGGYVYVNTGLLRITQGEDELAAAMAHEVGHVVARHGLRNIKKAQRTAILFGILGVGADIATGGSGVGRAAGELLAAGVITKNSREFEREADYLGLYDMSAVGYDPEGMVRVFQRLAGATSAGKSPVGGGIFASHPDSGEREHNTEAEIREHLAGTVARTVAPMSSDGSTRARRAGAAGGNRVSYSPRAANDAAFAQMKRALANYQSGNYRANNGQNRYPRDNNRRGGYNDPYNRGGNQNDPYNRGGNQNDPYYNPNDPSNQPAQNDRPVLKRRP
jgi:predicted Zn-dependent protease